MISKCTNARFDFIEVVCVMKTPLVRRQTKVELYFTGLVTKQVAREGFSDEM